MVMFDELLTSSTYFVGDEIWQSLLSALGMFVSSVAGVLVSILGDATGLFQVGECNKSNCPGSFYLPITAAWANIGYMTHADFVYFVWNTSFGLWAALFYAVGATGALISVAINQPPRTYMWFFLGPPIYAFLVGTPTSVQGVAWRIADKSMDMKDVWRDAETGLANTALVKDLGIQVGRKDGPSGTYQVAWPMVFLDGLFSEATNNLIRWIGMQRREGRGGNDSNLFNKDNEQGPYQILANLKWGMVENIVGVNVKDPDVRDALATFLTSECGDWFKKGVNAGAYSAASLSRGSNVPLSVFIDTADPSSSGDNDRPQPGDYEKFVHGLDVESIPTPRSMVRLFNAPNLTGSFRQFSTKFSGNQALDSGRVNEIVCSEYLYMIVQAIRWEAGHAYWQLIRSFPKGFGSEAVALKTLFYGWNLRESADAPMLSDADVKQYAKFLILVHMFRNELIIAPQITELSQRFSASEQMRGYTEAYVKQQGSRAKYGELYQWAVMMPHVQGVLAYLVLIGYPFAAMLMVIPGYWKAFFTWVSFFAWVKLWDVGFAIVHALERSVWAMIGNNSAMARVGRRLINTAKLGNGDINVSCGGGVGEGAAGGGAGGLNDQQLAELCSVPNVKEAEPLSEDNAWFLLDQSLAVAGSLDLDLSNGYYIYIMAALYFAVPAVTGQLVLGAKASLGGLATQAMGQSATEAGGAAKSGTVGENANRLQTNQASIDQGARMKSYRQSGFAQQSLDQQNAAMDTDIRGAEIGGMSRAFEGIGNAAQMTADSQDSNVRQLQAFGNVPDHVLKAVNAFVPTGGAGMSGAKRPASAAGTGMAARGQRAGGGLTSAFAGDGDSDATGVGSSAPGSGSSGASPGSAPSPSSSSGGGSGSGLGDGGVIGSNAVGKANALWGAADGIAEWGLFSHANMLKQRALGHRARGAAAGLNLNYDKSAQELFKGGYQASGQRMGGYSDFEAASAAWDAKAQFSNLSGLFGVYGGNPGSLGPGQKPGDMMSFALSGGLGSDARDAARYPGSSYFWAAGTRMAKGKQQYGGGAAYGNFFRPMSVGYTMGGAWGALANKGDANSPTNELSIVAGMIGGSNQLLGSLGKNLTSIGNSAASFVEGVEDGRRETVTPGDHTGALSRMGSQVSQQVEAGRKQFEKAKSMTMNTE